MNEDIIYRPDKLKSAVYYIINKCGLNDNVDRTVIYKLLYFSDFNYYELYEKPITGDRYIKKSNGPISSHFLGIKDELIDEGKISEKLEYLFKFKRYKYSSIDNLDISNLSDDELFVLNDSINKISNMSARQISDYSRGDLPWRVAEDNEEIDYEYVFYRDPEHSVREYND